MRVTAIEIQPRNPERADVFVDGELRCGAARDALRAEGVEVGSPISAEALARLAGEDDVWKAREAALALLSYRARSAAELRSRLRRKGHGPAAVDAAIARLTELGLLDDAAFAGSFVRDRIRNRPRGARRLLSELRGRGIEGEQAHAAVEEAMAAEGASELDLARAAAAAWVRRRQRFGRGGGTREDAAAMKRSLYGHLARRGFSADAIRMAIRDALAAASIDAPPDGV